ELKQAWGERLVELSELRRGFAPHKLAEPFKKDAEVLGKLIVDRDPDMPESDANRSAIKPLISMLADFYVDAIRRATGADLPLITADQPKVIDALAELGLPSLHAALRR